MSKKVIITDRPLPHIEEERRIVEEAGGYLDVYDVRSRDELLSVLPGTHVVMANLAAIDREMILNLEDTRGIVRYGVGYDAIDVEAATEKGIYVANVPGFCNLDVAEHTLGLLLSLSRKIPEFDSFVRGGKYVDTSGYKKYRPIPRLAGKTAGIIGFGNIGREVAKRMLAFGLIVLVHDPYLDTGTLGDLEGRIQLTDLEPLMVESDVVSIHAPLNEETRGMIGKNELEMMKETALLLNVARGGIVDEEELARVVESGRITAAAVDTLSSEPPPSDNPLLGVDKILVTPHIAWYSEESVMDLETMAATQAAQILRGEVPTNLVNRELLDRTQE